MKKSPLIDKYTYPNINKVVDIISKQNPLQGKSIKKYIKNQDFDYYNFAENLCKNLINNVFSHEKELIEAGSFYNKMCMDFLKEQIYFQKTGLYRLNSENIAKEEVYDQPDIMRYYMVGLLLSYMFWPNHYKILCFLKNHIGSINNINNFLDIAPGHGLFTVEVFNIFPESNGSLIDISETSINVTKDILSAFKVNLDQLNFIKNNIFSVSFEQDEFDFILMGELLEHVENPLELLIRVRNFLSLKGTIFITTCANSPAIDHVYHFHLIEEIQSHIIDSGYIINKEQILPLDTGQEQRFSTINYCAILSKK